MNCITMFFTFDIFSPCSFYHNAVATVVKIFLLEAKFWDINFETFNLFNLILLFLVF